MGLAPLIGKTTVRFGDRLRGVVRTGVELGHKAGLVEIVESI